MAYQNPDDRSPTSPDQPWAASWARAASTYDVNLVHIESEISTFPALTVYLVVIGDIETRLSQDQWQPDVILRVHSRARWTWRL